MSARSAELLIDAGGIRRRSTVREQRSPKEVSSGDFLRNHLQSPSWDSTYNLRPSSTVGGGFSPRSCSRTSSVRLAQRQGDARWRDTLDAHNALAERLSARYGGRIVDTAGDGALAAFNGPTPGMEYARAFSEAVHELGLTVRAGVHAGEVERRGNDLAGIGIHVGARVAALAGADQILVTSTVRELVFGSLLTFSDRGYHELKGVDGSWHLYELNLNSA